MKTVSLQYIVLCCTLLAVCHGIGWSPGSLEDGAMIYICKHDDLILPWSVTKGTGGPAPTISWYYHGRSTTTIASFGYGLFGVGTAFLGRVERTSNAGLILHRVTSSDAGNYSVQVHGQDANGLSTVLHRIAHVFVSEGLMTEDGDLHAGQSPVAVYNNATKQFQAQLTCGTFIPQNKPPFYVLWTTPAGQVVNSSFYQDGQFVLLLDNPVTGGSYTCHIPEDQARAACLHGNQQAGKTFIVDEVKVRFSLAEARQASLVAEIIRLRSQLARIQERISFHATGLRHATIFAGQSFVFPNVVNNEGNAYNSATGRFVAPHNGTYFFIATTDAYDAIYVTNMLLMVDQKRIDYARMKYSGDVQSGSVHAVVQLSVGQTVWVETDSRTTVWSIGSAFSGFLVSTTAP